MTTKVIAALKANTGGGGSIPIEYDTYADLPATAGDGTVALVTTTPSTEAYTFVTAVDGFEIGRWFPTEFVVRGLAYAKTAGGKSSRISVGVGGDTIADLIDPARGWLARYGGALGSAADSSVTDGAGYLIFNSGTTAFAVCGLQLVVTTPDYKDVFGWVEWETDTLSSINALVPGVYFHEGRLCRLGNSVEGANQHGFTNNATSRVGSGGQLNAGFEPLHFSGNWGGTPTDRQHWDFWVANEGRVIPLAAGDSPMASCNHLDWTTNSSGGTVNPLSVSRNTSVCIGHIKEFHLFEVG